MKPLCQALGLSAEKVDRLPELDPEDEAQLTKAVAAKRGLAWKVIKRGFWTNGTPDLQSWLPEMTKWAVADCAPFDLLLADVHLLSGRDEMSR